MPTTPPPPGCARDDRRIDVLAAEVERLAVQTIALRAPLAVDLREVVAALKIAGVVERIGDYAKNIAKRVPLVEEADGGGQRIEPVSTLPAMARMAGSMVRAALDAFAARDAEAAAAVRDSDVALDDFYDSIFRTLVTYMVENPRTITQVAHLLFVAKNLERIGDHRDQCRRNGLFRRHRQPAGGTQSQGGAMTRPRMLLVEDDPAISELLQFHFGREEFDVAHTVDGEEALLMARETPPDIVLLDWMVEGLSGLEVCRRLRRSPATANVPIIMLTARGEEEDRVRGLETGADDYVTKPFSPRELVARVNAVLRPRPASAGGRGAALRRSGNGSGFAQGEARRRDGAARADGVPAAQALPGASRLGVLARAAAGRGVGA